MKIVINKHISFNKVDDTVGELDLMGDIVDYRWFDEDVSPKSITDALSKLNGIKTLKLNVSSNGGSVTAGNTIINALRNFKNKNGVIIEAYVTWAASMMSGIITVADKVYQYENGLQMLHKPWCKIAGNSDYLRKTADELDKYEETLIANYRNKFKGSEDELRQILSDETTFTAQEALDCGLADEIIKSIEIAAYADKLKVNNTFVENQRYVEIFKNKVKDIKEEREVYDMKYNEMLNTRFNIEEETFNAMSIESFIEAVENKFREENPSVIIDSVPEFITKEEFLNLVKKDDVTSDEIKNLIQKGLDYKEPDEDMINKAKEFEKVKSEKVKDVLVIGVKAFGEGFNSTSMEKMFETMNYKQVCDMGETWEIVAKQTLNAGVKVSEPQKTITVDKNLKY